MRSCVQKDMNEEISKFSILGRCVHLLKNIRNTNGMSTSKNDALMYLVDYVEKLGVWKVGALTLRY